MSLTIVLAYEPLRVSLDDLLSADTKGKWWLVGAGWSGNPLLDRQIDSAAPKKKNVKEVKEDEEILLDLARKQGMNTDVRRSVFVTLMTSEVSTTTGYRKMANKSRITFMPVIASPTSNSMRISNANLYA
jgi:hypothetical protein